jgi:glycosyltransferase involved in cell wall biosynthesis
MEIDYISGPRTEKIFGMSKYQMEIFKRIEQVEWNIIEYDSILQSLEKKYNVIFTSKSYNASNKQNSVKSPAENKLFNFLIEMGKRTFNSIDRNRYINIVKKGIKNGNVKHITYQDLAYLLNSIKMDNTILTCHDLIPWIYEKNRSKMWKDNIKGLKKADKIITGSEFSKNEIIKHLNYPENRIQVVKDAVDHSAYYPHRSKIILNTRNIPTHYKFILYVGSETPRMNVPTLLKAFYQLKKRFSPVKLLKIGDPQSFGVREKNLRLIKDLNLERDVIFLGYVPEDELPQWYNAADVSVYPCLYAGFGLPPLEAMACGTPVITSNTTSLPEVVGDAGIMIEPTDYNLLAEKMYQVLNNNGLREDMMKKGLKRAQIFNWDKSSKDTLQIYELMNK